MNAQAIIKKGLFAVGIILVILFAVLTTLISVNAEDSKIGAAVVLSGSMEPALSVNDVIFFVKQDGYKAGDIVVFSDDGTKSVHRIVKSSPKEIVTKGDFNNAEDKPITPDKIIGKVRLKLPAIGALFHTKQGGVNAKYASEGLAEMTAKMETGEIETVGKLPSTFFVFYPNLNVKLTTYKIYSGSGKQRKMNIKLERTSGSPNVSFYCQIKTNQGNETINFKQVKQDMVLTKMFNVSEGPLEAEITLGAISSPYAVIDSSYSYNIYTEIIGLDQDGNETYHKSIYSGKMTVWIEEG